MKNNKKIKLGILTSSRADYGIYKPLLDKIKTNTFFEIHLIVFGMHLQKQHGYTYKSIVNDGYELIHKVKGMPFEDNSIDISKGYGNLISSFSNFWNSHFFDWVLVVGDRFEMSAAVQSAIPFEIQFAHIHAGEVTLGSVDNIYRDQISLASKIYFTSNEYFSKRLKTFVHFPENIFNVGSLSLDGLSQISIPSWKNVSKKFNLPNRDFILVTFHPETVNVENSFRHIKIICETLIHLSKYICIVITQTNADNMGSKFRNSFKDLSIKNPENIYLVDSFGKLNYFSAIKNSKFLLGNTSSGIIEAASFKKFVINVGDRQKGRLKSKNIIDVPFDKEQILISSKLLLNKNIYSGSNVYSKKNTANNIIKKLININ